MANGIQTIKYIQIVEAEDKLYLIYFSPKFYDLFDLFYKPEGSYYNILYRLFGLLPQDFYHMLAKEYHAIFQKSPVLKNHVYVRFKHADALTFCNEINRRIEYCIQRGDFS